MHAIRQHELGGPEVLRYEQMPDLEPAEGQVRVAVEACGVHLVDTFMRRGEFHVPTHLPCVPGREVAGVVDAVGPGVDPTWIDSRVTAHLGMVGGGYATQAVVSVASVHRVSPALPLDVAVAAVGTGRTAVGVLDHVELGRDDVVLITAASGGLGSVLAHAAQHAGATVVGLVGGAAKKQLLLTGGVHAVDYRGDGWESEVRELIGGDRATIVLDGVGGETSWRAYRLLGSGGVLVNYTGAEPDAYADPDRTMISPLAPGWMDDRPGGLRGAEEDALAAAVDGSRVPVVGSTFALSDAADAHRALESRQTHGKVVLLTGSVR